MTRRRARPEPPQDPAPAVVVPPLLPCPVCGLRVEAGTSPHGLAWHDCDGHRRRSSPEAPVTIESVEAVLLRRLQQQAAEATPREMVDILRALEGLRPRPAAPTGAPEPTDGSMGELRSWAARGK